MKRQTAAIALVLAAVGLLAWPMLADPPKGKPARGPRVRPRVEIHAARPDEGLARIQQGLRVQRQFAELMECPPAASHLAIMRIKDLAIEHRKPELGIKALAGIAAGADHPAVRRGALFALSELHAANDDPAEAIGALADLCRTGGKAGGAEGQVAAEARRVHRWLRAHPGPARRIIGSLMEAGGHCAYGPSDGPRAARLARPTDRPGRAGGIAATIERLRRRLDEAGRRCDPPPREGMRPDDGPEARPPRDDRRPDDLHEFAERLRRRGRELDERAEQLERRCRELDRAFEDLHRERLGRDAGDRLRDMQCWCEEMEERLNDLRRRYEREGDGRARRGGEDRPRLFDRPDREEEEEDEEEEEEEED